VCGTSRKWLAGPRGVGFLAVDRASWPALSVPPRPDVPPDLPVVAVLTAGEANVAGRAGLATAVAEYVEDGPQLVADRLDEVGEQTRSALAGVRGWAVVPGQTGPITALRPTGGQDVVCARERLRADHGILTTASLPWRAPLELDEGWLRVSPHVDLTEAALVALAEALPEA
jgi:pyridoxal 5-phosphate dependent beta-lyase